MAGWRTDFSIILVAEDHDLRRDIQIEKHNLTIMRSCCMQITHKRLWHCLLIILRREEISWKMEVTLNAVFGCYQMLHNSAFQRTNRGSVLRRKMKRIRELIQPELANSISYVLWPISVVERSKAWTVFARSNTGILGSNPTRGMNVCVRLFCV
jgi:hypothetical protein